MWTMAATSALRDTNQTNESDQELLRRNDMQGGPWQLERESGKDACCHHSYFSWQLTGSWRRQQQGREMEFSGHLGTSSVTWIWWMTLPYSHTMASRCKRKHLTSQLSQPNLASGYMKERQKFWKPVKLRGKPLEEVESFTYPGSIIDKQAGTDADVKA